MSVYSCITKKRWLDAYAFKVKNWTIGNFLNTTSLVLNKSIWISGDTPEERVHNFQAGCSWSIEDGIYQLPVLSSTDDGLLLSGKHGTFYWAKKCKIQAANIKLPYIIHKDMKLPYTPRLYYIGASFLLQNVIENAIQSAPLWYIEIYDYLRLSVYSIVPPHVEPRYREWLNITEKVCWYLSKNDYLDMDAKETNLMKTEGGIFHVDCELIISLREREIQRHVSLGNIISESYEIMCNHLAITLFPQWVGDDDVSLFNLCKLISAMTVGISRKVYLNEKESYEQLQMNKPLMNSLKSLTKVTEDCEFTENGYFLATMIINYFPIFTDTISDLGDILHKMFHLKQKEDLSMKEIEYLRCSLAKYQGDLLILLSELLKGKEPSLPNIPNFLGDWKTLFEKKDVFENPKVIFSFLFDVLIPKLRVMRMVLRPIDDMTHCRFLDLPSFIRELCEQRYYEHTFVKENRAFPAANVAFLFEVAAGRAGKIFYGFFGHDKSFKNKVDLKPIKMWISAVNYITNECGNPSQKDMEKVVAEYIEGSKFMACGPVSTSNHFHQNDRHV